MKDTIKNFSQRFWRGFFICLAAAMGIVIILLSIGLIAFYGQKYHW